MKKITKTLHFAEGILVKDTINALIENQEADHREIERLKKWKYLVDDALLVHTQKINDAEPLTDWCECKEPMRQLVAPFPNYIICGNCNKRVKPLTDRRELLRKKIKSILKAAMNVTPYTPGALTDKKILDTLCNSILDIVGRL